MSTTFRKFSGVCLAAAALSLSAAAQAQSTGTTSGSAMSSSGDSGMGSMFSRNSWFRPGSGYIGFNVGRSDYGGGCGIGAFDCDDTSDVYNLYVGNMWNRNLGLELGMTDFGDIDRNNGTTQAYGFSASLVGNWPLTESFSVFGKLGTMYGRTRISGVGTETGSDSGWGSTYGLGVNFDITPQLAAVVQIDQTNLRFVTGREHINTTSIGLKYRF